MNRRTLNALEKVFAAEIEGRLPFQSPAKVYRELCEKGLLDTMERKFGTGVFAVIAKGYELTHAGRYAYCASCKDPDETPREEYPDNGPTDPRETSGPNS